MLFRGLLISKAKADLQIGVHVFLMVESGFLSLLVSLPSHFHNIPSHRPTGHNMRYTCPVSCDLNVIMFITRDWMGVLVVVLR